MGFKEVMQKRKEEIEKAKVEDKKELESKREEEVLVTDKVDPNNTGHQTTDPLLAYLQSDSDRVAQSRFELMKRLIQIEVRINELDEKISSLLEELK